jgi:oligosaccharide repeat unit polymerase
MSGYGEQTSLTYLAAIALLIVALLAFARWRSFLCPHVIFPLYWSATLLATSIIRIGDHALTIDALLVFTLGGIVFSVASGAGSLISGARVRPRARSPLLTDRGKRAVQAMVVLYGLGLLLVLPAFVVAIRTAAEAAGIQSFAVAARASLLLADRGGIPQFFSSLTSVGMILAYFTAWMYRGARRDRVALGVITLGCLSMSILTFSRTAVVALLIGVVGIMSLQRTIRPRTAVLLPLGALVLAIVMGTLLSTGPEFGTGRSALHAVMRNLAVYFIGGPLGFAAVMSEPLAVGERLLSLRFFTQPASWIGLGGELPNLVLGYVSIELGNVYTFYFPYWLDWGWVGVLLAPAAAGFLAGVVYNWARSGSAFGGAAYAIVISSVLTSAVGDGFFTSAMTWILVMVVGWMLRRVAMVALRSGHAAPAGSGALAGAASA